MLTLPQDRLLRILRNEKREYMIDKFMIAWFQIRTNRHLRLVHKWSDKIADLSDNRIDKVLLDKERNLHDSMKFLEPEYTPYVYITWNYKCKREGVPFEMTKEMQDAANDATFHHIKNHRHHPEYWDDNATKDVLNDKDRDKPSGVIVDATKMPLTYVASMVADWFAMSEELRTNPSDWAKKNINVRWKFTNAQVDLIYDLIRDVWDKHTAQ